MTRLGAADFGIVGDGVTDSTDGFLALHAHLLRDRDRMWEVEFPPGHYLTRASHWLTNVGHVRLIGNGATLQHLVANKGLFSPSEIFRHLVSGDPFPATQLFEHHPGYRIASVQAGEHEVRFLDGVVPAGMVPGAIVFIGGYNQQLQNQHLPPEQWRSHGWPPNLRFFDYGRVRAVRTDSVALIHQLRHSYDEAWTDYPGDYFGPFQAGAPRLYLCDRPGFAIPRRIEMYGFRFLRALGSTTGGHLGFTAAMYLHLEDCVIQEDDRQLACYVQMNDRLVLRRCTFDTLEIDKCLRHVLIDDCDIGSHLLNEGGNVGEIAGRGAGSLQVEVINSRVYGNLAINPRTVILNNVLVHGNLSLSAQHGGYYPTTPFVVSTLRADRP